MGEEVRSGVSEFEEAVARGEAQARAAMEEKEREPVVRVPAPEPSMDDPDIPEWVRKYGPRRKTGHTGDE